MTTRTVLLLLQVVAASTVVLCASEGLTSHRFAVDQPAYQGILVRRLRDIPAASKSGSGAISFASSASSAGSTSGSGTAPGYNTYSTRSGSFDGAPGYSDGKPSGVVFPEAGDYDSYGYTGQNPYNPYGGAGYVPVDFNALFQQYLAFMQRLAQQQAYALNGYGNFVHWPYYYPWTAGAPPFIPSSVVAASLTSTPYYYKAARYYYTPSAIFTYSNKPVSMAPYYNMVVPSTRRDKQQASYFNAYAPVAQYYSTPISSAQHFSTISHSHATAGAAVRHHSHSNAQVAFQPVDSAREVNSRAGFPGQQDFDGPPGFVFPEATHFGGGGPVSASASASLSPRGGFGSVSISPPPQGNLGLGARMGSVPASGGPNYSVFSSSSSSSSDENGVKKSSKQATSVINDNGKVTTFHVSDP